MSYRRLILEHDEIEQSAGNLLHALDDAGASAATLFAMFSRLAVAVKGHIEHEERILSSLSQAQLDGSWVKKWMSAAQEFDRLCVDWLRFLEAWGVEDIETRREAFAQAARDVLLRLNERVQFETETFYAAALQSGAIHLR